MRGSWISEIDSGQLFKKISFGNQFFFIIKKKAKKDKKENRIILPCLEKGPKGYYFTLLIGKRFVCLVFFF